MRYAVRYVGETGSGIADNEKAGSDAPADRPSVLADTAASDHLRLGYWDAEPRQIPFFAARCAFEIRRFSMHRGEALDNHTDDPSPAFEKRILYRRNGRNRFRRG